MQYGTGIILASSTQILTGMGAYSALDFARSVYTVHYQGVVVTAKTGIKKWSTGQGVFLSLAKQSRTIFISRARTQLVLRLSF